MTPDELDKIAEAAAQRALEKVYAEVGKSVVKRLLWILGLAAIGALMWLTANKYVSLPVH